MAYARAAHINPLQFGLMGAALGGLQFLLDDMTRKRAEEAELQKEQRLQAIRMQEEQRTNDEWTRRTAIDQQNAQANLQLTQQAENQRQAASQTFQAGQNEANRAHDFAIEDTRNTNETARQMTVAEQEAKLHRANTAYDETFKSVISPRGGEKGMYGSDGKFYPTGAQMPVGVTPTVGFGATNLGLRGTGRGSTYVSPRGQPVGAVNPMAGAAPAATGGYPEGTRLRGPDGRTYVVQNGVPVPL